MHYVCTCVADISMWASNSTVVDVMVRPSAIPRVTRFLKERRVNYDIVIADLQQAINQENPTPSAEEIDELEGRNGTIRWQKYNYRHCIQMCKKL